MLYYSVRATVGGACRALTPWSQRMLLMGRHSFIARQLRKPSGIYGKYVLSRYMNKADADLNTQTLTSLDLQPDDRVLEVGFGGGDLISRMLPLIDKGSVTGVDYSSDMVALCGKRFSPSIAAGQVELICANAEALPFEADSFSKVCTVSTIYFWSQPAVALDELSRVLRPNGRLVVGFVPRSTMSKFPETEHGFTLYDSEEVAQLLREAGFREVNTITGTDRRGEFACVIGEKNAED